MDGQAEAIPGVGNLTDRLKLGSRDLAGLRLSPEEMFVVTRLMGGELSVTELLSATGLPRERAIAVVRALVAEQVFVRLEPAAVPVRAAAVPSAPAPSRPSAVVRPPLRDPPPPPRQEAPSAPPAAAATSAEPPIDPTALDLPADKQRELAELERRTRSNDPWEILGLTPSASADQIRSAYFALAQRFHPDQFFRKRLGTFQGKVELIFGKISGAFHQLSRDPGASATGGGAQAPGGSPVQAVGAPETSLPPLSDGPPLDTDLELPEPGDPALAAEPPIYGRPRERLAQAIAKKSFGIAEEALAQLALEEPGALDVPKLRNELARARDQHLAQEAYEKGLALADKEEWAEALKKFEAAAAHDPRNAVYVERIARALLYSGELREAKRMAERAVELDPSVAEFHVTMGNAFIKAGMERNARREFEIALKLDPKNQYAKSQVRKGWWKA